MSVFRDMARDAGYRGDEADQVAASLEQREMEKAYEAAADETAEECAAHGHPLEGSTCRCGENHL